MRNVCPNCGIRLTCSCQKEISSDGKAVCVQCIEEYELKRQKDLNENTQSSTDKKEEHQKA